mgnify:CR=1 FL=1
MQCNAMKTEKFAIKKRKRVQSSHATLPKLLMRSDLNSYSESALQNLGFAHFDFVGWKRKLVFKFWELFLQKKSPFFGSFSRTGRILGWDSCLLTDVSLLRSKLCYELSDKSAIGLLGLLLWLDCRAFGQSGVHIRLCLHSYEIALLETIWWHLSGWLTSMSLLRAL